MAWRGPRRPTGAGRRRLGARALAERTVVYPGDTVYAVDHRADGARALATHLGGGRVEVGDAVLGVRRQATVRDVAWSPTGDPVALVSWDGALSVVDPARRVLVATVALGAGRAQVVRWSPDARWLAVGGDGGLVHVATIAAP